MAVGRLREWLRTPENASVATGVVLSVPTAAAVDQVLHLEGLGFLLLVTLGVVVPTTYRTQWHGGDETASAGDGESGASARGAVAWTVAAGVAAGLALSMLALGLSAVARQSDIVASSVAFVAVAMGGPLLAGAVGRRWAGGP